MSEYKSNSEIRMGSERSFGIVFCVVFAIVGLFPLWGGGEPRIWALLVSGAFLAIGFLAPWLLRPLNRLWFLFGLLLNRIVSPVVMGILFFLTVTPVGLLRRLFNRDPLNQNIDPDAASYWIPADRNDSTSSMRKQF